MLCDRTKYHQVDLSEAIHLGIIPPETQTIINNILRLDIHSGLIEYLERFSIWTYARVGLNCWLDVLDKFDLILDQCCSIQPHHKWTMFCDVQGNEIYQRAAEVIMIFTKSLMEYALSRQIYNSFDHVVKLLNSTNLKVIYAATKLLFVTINRSSNFLSRIPKQLSKSIIEQLSSMGKPFGSAGISLDVDKCMDDNFLYSTLGIGKMKKRVSILDNKKKTSINNKHADDKSNEQTKNNQDILSPSPSIDSSKYATILIDVDKERNSGLRLNEIIEKILQMYHVHPKEIPGLFQCLLWHFYFPDMKNRIQLYCNLYIFYSLMIKTHAKIVYEILQTTGNFVNILNRKDRSDLQPLQSNILKCIALIFQSNVSRLYELYDSLAYVESYGTLPTLFHSKVQDFIHYKPGHNKRPSHSYLLNLHFTLRSLFKDPGSSEFFVSSHLLGSIIDLIRFQPFTPILKQYQKSIINGLDFDWVNLFLPYKQTLHAHLIDYMLISRCIRLIHVLVSNYRDLIDAFRIIQLLLERCNYELMCVKFLEAVPSHLREAEWMPHGGMATVSFFSMIRCILLTVIYYAQTSDVGVYEMLFNGTPSNNNADFSHKKLWLSLLENHHLFSPYLVYLIVDFVVAVISDEVSDLDKFIEQGIIKQILDIIFQKNEKFERALFSNMQSIYNLINTLCLNQKSLKLLLEYQYLKHIFKILFYHENLMISTRPVIEFNADKFMPLDSILICLMQVVNSTSELKDDIRLQIQECFEHYLDQLLYFVSICLSQDFDANDFQVRSLSNKSQVNLSGTKLICNDPKFECRRERFIHRLKYSKGIELSIENIHVPTLIYIDTYLHNFQIFLSKLRDFGTNNSLLPLNISLLKDFSQSEDDETAKKREFEIFKKLYLVAEYSSITMITSKDPLAEWVYRLVNCFKNESQTQYSKIFIFFLDKILQSIAQLNSLISPKEGESFNFEFQDEHYIHELIIHYSKASFSLKLFQHLIDINFHHYLFSDPKFDPCQIMTRLSMILLKLSTLVINNSQFIIEFSIQLGSYFNKQSIDDENFGFSLDDRYFFSAQSHEDVLAHDTKVINLFRNYESNIINSIHAIFNINHEISDPSKSFICQCKNSDVNIQMAHDKNSHSPLTMLGKFLGQLVEPVVSENNNYYGTHEKLERLIINLRLIIDIFFDYDWSKKRERFLYEIISLTISEKNRFDLISRPFNLLCDIIDSLMKSSSINDYNMNKLHNKNNLMFEIIVIYLSKMLLDKDSQFWSDNSSNTFNKIINEFSQGFSRFFNLLKTTDDDGKYRINHLFHELCKNENNVIIFHQFLLTFCKRLSICNNSQTNDENSCEESLNCLLSLQSYINNLSLDNFSPYHALLFPLHETLVTKLIEFSYVISNDHRSFFLYNIKQIVTNYSFSISLDIKNIMGSKSLDDYSLQQLSKKLIAYCTLYELEILEFVNELNSSTTINDTFNLLSMICEKETNFLSLNQKELIIRLQSNLVELCMAQARAMHDMKVDSIFTDMIKSCPFYLLQSSKIATTNPQGSYSSEIDHRSKVLAAFSKSSNDILGLKHYSASNILQMMYMAKILSPRFFEMTDTNSNNFLNRVNILNRYNSEISLINNLLNYPSKLSYLSLDNDKDKNKSLDAFNYLLETHENTNFNNLIPSTQSFVLLTLFPSFKIDRSDNTSKSHSITNDSRTNQIIIQDFIKKSKNKINDLTTQSQKAMSEFYGLSQITLGHEKLKKLITFILDSFDLTNLNSKKTMLASKLLFLIQISSDHEMCTFMLQNPNNILERILCITFISHDINEEHEILALITTLIHQLITQQNYLHCEAMLSKTMLSHMSLIKSSHSLSSSSRIASKSENNKSHFSSDTKNNSDISKINLTTFLGLFNPALALQPKLIAEAFSSILLKQELDIQMSSGSNADETISNINQGSPCFDLSKFSKNLSEMSFNNLGNLSNKKYPINLSNLETLLYFILNGQTYLLHTKNLDSSSKSLPEYMQSSTENDVFYGRVSQSLATQIFAELLFEVPEIMDFVQKLDDQSFKWISSKGINSNINSNNSVSLNDVSGPQDVKQSFMECFMSNNLLSRDLYGSAVLLILTIIFRTQSSDLVSHVIKQIKQLFVSLLDSKKNNHSTSVDAVKSFYNDDNEFNDPNQTHKLHNLTILFQTIMAQSNIMMTSGVYSLHQWRITLIWQTFIQCNFFDDLIQALRSLDLSDSANSSLANDILLSVSFVSEVFGNYMRFSNNKQLLLKSLFFNNKRKSTNFTDYLHHQNLCTESSFIDHDMVQSPDELPSIVNNSSQNNSSFDESIPIIEVDFENSEYVSDTLSTASYNSIIVEDNESVYSMDSLNNINDNNNSDANRPLNRHNPSSTSNQNARNVSSTNVNHQYSDVLHDSDPYYTSSDFEESSSFLTAQDHLSSENERISNMSEPQENHNSIDNISIAHQNENSYSHTGYINSDKVFETGQEENEEMMDNDTENQAIINNNNLNNNLDNGNINTGDNDDEQTDLQIEGDSPYEEFLIDMEHPDDDDNEDDENHDDDDNEDDDAQSSFDFYDDYITNDVNYDEDEIEIDQMIYRNGNRNDDPVLMQDNYRENFQSQQATESLQILLPLEEHNNSNIHNASLNSENNDIVAMIPDLQQRFLEMSQKVNNNSLRVHSIYQNMVSFFRPSNNLQILLQKSRNSSPTSNKASNGLFDVQNYYLNEYANDKTYLPSNSCIIVNRSKLKVDMTNSNKQLNPIFTLKSITEKLFQIPGILQFMPLALNRASDLLHLIFNCNGKNSTSCTKLRSIAFFSIFFNAFDHIIENESQQVFQKLCNRIFNEMQSKFDSRDFIEKINNSNLNNIVHPSSLLSFDINSNNLSQDQSLLSALPSGLKDDIINNFAILHASQLLHHHCNDLVDLQDNFTQNQGLVFDIHHQNDCNLDSTVPHQELSTNNDNEDNRDINGSVEIQLDMIVQDQENPSQISINEHLNEDIVDPSNHTHIATDENEDMISSKILPNNDQIDFNNDTQRSLMMFYDNFAKYTNNSTIFNTENLAILMSMHFYPSAKISKISITSILNHLTNNPMIMCWIIESLVSILDYAMNCSRLENSKSTIRTQWNEITNNLTIDDVSPPSTSTTMSMNKSQNLKEYFLADIHHKKQFWPQIGAFIALKKHDGVARLYLNHNIAPQVIHNVTLTLRTIIGPDRYSQLFFNHHPSLIPNAEPSMWIIKESFFQIFAKLEDLTINIQETSKLNISNSSCSTSKNSQDLSHGQIQKNQVKLACHSIISDNFMICLLHSLLKFLQANDFLYSTNSKKQQRIGSNYLDHIAIVKSLRPLMMMLHKFTRSVLYQNETNILEALGQPNNFDPNKSNFVHKKSNNDSNNDKKQHNNKIEGIKFFYSELERFLPKFLTILEQHHYSYSPPSALLDFHAKIFQILAMVCNPVENLSHRFLKSHLKIVLKSMSWTISLCNTYFKALKQLKHKNDKFKDFKDINLFDRISAENIALNDRDSSQNMTFHNNNNHHQQFEQQQQFEDQTFHDRFQNRQIIITAAASMNSSSSYRKPLDVDVESYRPLISNNDNGMVGNFFGNSAIGSLSNSTNGQFFIQSILYIVKSEIRRIQHIKTNQIVTQNEILHRLSFLLHIIDDLQSHELHDKILDETLTFIDKELIDGTTYVEPLIPIIRNYFQTLAFGIQLHGMIHFDLEFSIEDDEYIKRLSRDLSDVKNRNSNNYLSYCSHFNKLIDFSNRHTRLLRHVIGDTQNCFVYLQSTRLLINYSNIFDFNTKQSYFYSHLLSLSKQSQENIDVARQSVFTDSFNFFDELETKNLHNRFVVQFADESGQDEGGMLREWYSILSHEIFNSNYCLFETKSLIPSSDYTNISKDSLSRSTNNNNLSTNNTTTTGLYSSYHISPASHINPLHLRYFKFVGRLIGRAIFDKKHMDCSFTRSLYKHILGLPINFQDLAFDDSELYDGLKFILDNQIDTMDLGLTFSMTTSEFGNNRTIDLIDGGGFIEVNDENKHTYIRLMTDAYLKGLINEQLSKFLEGFYEVIPKNLITIFNEQELELLIAGLKKYDIDDLEANTEYLNGYSSTSPQVIWLFEILRSYDDNLQALFFHFVTGSSRIPIQGFAHLQGMNGVQKFAISLDNNKTERLPSAHTCFNQIDVPQYETKEKFERLLRIAITEGQYGFGMA